MLKMIIQSIRSKLADDSNHNSNNNKSVTCLKWRWAEAELIDAAPKKKKNNKTWTE